jgi:DNA-binding transcriptional LysR family regulator
MELHHLQTFVVVADEKSITQAARRLFTTPSSISAHIKTLEDELGVQLFTRTPRGMHITEKGEALVLKARQTLQSVRDLVNQATELRANLMGEVSLGVNAGLNYLRLPELIHKLSQDAPGISLHLHHQASGHVLENVAAQQLDLGFVFGEVTDTRLSATPLTTAELVIAAPPNWAVESPDWAELARHPWICGDYYCPFQVIIDRVFAERGLSYPQHIHTNDDPGKADLVAAGLGLALLEAGEAQAYAAQGRLRVIPGVTFQTRLSLVYLSYRQHDPLIKALIEVVAGLWE